jgi:hypothetical protein
MAVLLGLGASLSCGRFLRHGNPLQWKTYSNRYLRVDYPVGYHVEDGFDYGVDDFKGDDKDVSGPLGVNELDLLPTDPADDSPWIHIVLSRIKVDAPLSLFAQMSMAGKDDYDGVLVSDMDSTALAGYPAMSLAFKYPCEDGDTLVQHQFIVRTDKRELYYVNLNYFKSRNTSPEYLDPMCEALASLKL